MKQATEKTFPQPNRAARRAAGEARRSAGPAGCTVTEPYLMLERDPRIKGRLFSITPGYDAETHAIAFQASLQHEARFDRAGTPESQRVNMGLFLVEEDRLILVLRTEEGRYPTDWVLIRAGKFEDFHDIIELMFPE
jgi:hypothetical protein